MELRPYVEQVQSQLAALAALGDEATRATAEALAGAAEPAVRLALLGMVTAAADEITAALLEWPGAPTVSVHLDGDHLRPEVHSAESIPEADGVMAGYPDEADGTSRISLRVPEALKAQVESAARSRGVSVNTWIVRAVSSAVSGSPPGLMTGKAGRLTGWING
jgi:hypothetical protein